MSNSYFQFKQFKVEQSKCAMKVGTDGVLLGAWTKIRETKNILDVGAGSGLISLMLAQRSFHSKITAIDIDEGAAIQSAENFANTPWSDRLCIKHCSLQEFSVNNNENFDLIVCNPPYFSNSLKNPNIERTLARHTDSLPFKTLFSISSEFLSDNGYLSIIAPYIEVEKLKNIASDCNLYVSRQTNVIPTLEGMPKRVLLEFSKKEMPQNPITNLTIEVSRHVYTPEFTELTKDFYLEK